MQASRIAKQAKLILLALSAAAIVACGGGGGSTPVPPTAPVANAGVDQTVGIDRPVTLNGTGSSDANGDALTYAWTLITPAGSASVLSSATAAMPTFTADKAGTYTATLIVKDAALFSTADSATITVTANRAPTANAGAAQTKVAGDVVTLAGTGSDLDAGDVLSYAWTLVKPAGSAATLSNAATVSPSFTADVAGTYTASLIATDSTHTPNLSSPASTVTITVSANAVPMAVISSLSASAFRGSAIALSGASSTDANSDVLSFAWSVPSKPASSVAALVNGSTASATFTPDAVGVYTFNLVVTDARGGISSAAAATVTVVNNTVLTPNVFEPACSGANCGAISPTQYSGAGVGTWRYDNTSAAAATVNVDIAGVAAGKKVALVFTNGDVYNAAGLPSYGTDVSSMPARYARAMPAQTQLTPEQAMHARAIEARKIMLKRNELARKTPKIVASNAQILASANNSTIQALPPAIGATRTFHDTFPTPARVITAAVHSTCALGNGRQVVFWIDQVETLIQNTTMAAFKTAVCSGSGNANGFDKLTNLAGDFLGRQPFKTGGPTYNNVVADTLIAKQDVNILFTDNQGAGWAGYYTSNNNITSNADSDSALVFYMSTSSLRNTPSSFSLNYSVSTLIHEAAHMISFYQSYLRIGRDNESWLSETTAMMAEDIVTPSVISYNPMQAERIDNILSDQGGKSLNNWVSLGATSYNLGGSFGAFINRQYGINVFKSLFNGCSTGQALLDNYVCLNSLIAANGGNSAKEAFAKFGASLYAQLPPTGLPTGYGYPTTTDTANLVTLLAIDPSIQMLSAATPLTNFTSMTHTYGNYTIPAGITRFKRTGISVPAGTSLQVIVK